MSNYFLLTNSYDRASFYARFSLDYLHNSDPKATVTCIFNKRTSSPHCFIGLSIETVKLLGVTVFHTHTTATASFYTTSLARVVHCDNN